FDVQTQTCTMYQCCKQAFSASVCYHIKARLLAFPNLGTNGTKTPFLSGPPTHREAHGGGQPHSRLLAHAPTETVPLIAPSSSPTLILMYLLLNTDPAPGPQWSVSITPLSGSDLDRNIEAFSPARTGATLERSPLTPGCSHQQAAVSILAATSGCREH
ncbi:hypothetical protein NDU88_000725, partial [Pleurodeles waltl]